MQIEKLNLLNFKNYKEQALKFDKVINCFVGKNGSGKTNILDAIYFLLLTKSYFNQDAQLIRHQENHTILTANIQKREPFFISAKIENAKQKLFLLNKNPYKKITEHIGKFPVVMISPYDTGLIHGGSEDRRKFFDGILAQLNPDYLTHLLDYTKYLKQRNALLKQYLETSSIDMQLLSILDEQLVVFGNYIHQARSEFHQLFLPFFADKYTFLSDNAEKVNIVYDSKLNTENFSNLLKKYLDRDLASGRTNVGIHKDDYQFVIEVNSLQDFGSQGQQKTFIMAMKFANFEFHKIHTKTTPILLLDDIFDRIDANRIAKFVELINADFFGQIFITDTHFDRINELFSSMKDKVSIFKVEKGTIEQSAL